MNNEKQPNIPGWFSKSDSERVFLLNKIKFKLNTAKAKHKSSKAPGKGLTEKPSKYYKDGREYYSYEESNERSHKKKYPRDPSNHNKHQSQSYTFVNPNEGGENPQAILELFANKNIRQRAESVIVQFKYIYILGPGKSSQKNCFSNACWGSSGRWTFHGEE